MEIGDLIETESAGIDLLMKWFDKLFAGACGAVIVSQLVSCGALSRSVGAVGYNVKKLADDEGKFDINEGNSGAGSGGLNTLKGANNGNAHKNIGMLPSEEDIIWAPENPDVPIPGFEGLAMDDDNPQDSWYVDYKAAMQKARQEGKPMMVWFTSTRNSPLCKALSAELFASVEFNSWADENVIRLRVDSNVVESDKTKRVDRKKYIKNIKERYNVLGTPEVFILSPRGTEFGKYRGYKKGSADFYFGRLKNATRGAKRDYTSWRNEMESKGYRVWHNLSGKAVFAKVSRYRDGKIWLIEPDGRKSVTLVTRLSLEDQKHIEAKLAATRGDR